MRTILNRHGCAAGDDRGYRSGQGRPEVHHRGQCPERCKSVAVESAATVHAPPIPDPWLESDPFQTPRGRAHRFTFT